MDGTELAAPERLDTNFPELDVGPLFETSLVNGPVSPAAARTVSELNRALSRWGFFTLKEGSIDVTLLQRLEQLSRDFFKLPESEKMEISMSRGGSAWRGYFALGDEMTSGKPDGKAGIYFGSEDNPADKRLLHGANLWPDRPAGLAQAVQEYMAAALELGKVLMRGVALALGLAADFWERTGITADPTVLFRIFHYPDSQGRFEYGVGEHTDYGLLTILCVDASGGLQVRSLDGDEWIDVPVPEEGHNRIIINIGDMLERLTQGRFRSTPHRVISTPGRDRVSFPFFFDPSWESRPSDAIATLPTHVVDAWAKGAPPQRRARWDGAEIASWEGTHGEYLQAKVAKCFPQLFKHQKAL